MKYVTHCDTVFLGNNNRVATFVNPEELKKLSEARPIWNFKELSERIGISRQTLYNWKDEGWILTDENGKADLKRTVELWEEYKWNT